MTNAVISVGFYAIVTRFGKINYNIFQKSVEKYNVSKKVLMTLKIIKSFIYNAMTR